MTWFQWFIISWTVFAVVVTCALHGKPKNDFYNISDVIIRFGLINWALWYAGAWN